MLSKNRWKVNNITSCWPRISMENTFLAHLPLKYIHYLFIFTISLIYITTTQLCITILHSLARTLFALIDPARMGRNETLMENPMWPLECHRCQYHWMTLKVTFAVWNLSNSRTSWNVARIYWYSASRGPSAVAEFLVCKAVGYISNHALRK